MIIGRETITVLQDKPTSPPREGYIYLYSWNNLLWYMDYLGNEYCLPSSGLSLMTQLLEGNVYWDSGYTFNVTACLYMIRGITYQSEAGQITLDDADPDFDRIDVIYVDTDQIIGKITGAASENPQKPMVSPMTQLELTYVYIQAGSTSPAVDIEEVYFENAEWATSWDLEVGGLVNFVCPTSPYEGTYCTRVTIDPAHASQNLDGVQVWFDKSSIYNCLGSVLVLHIKTNHVWLNSQGNATSIYLSLILGASMVSQTPVQVKDGKYGFNSSLTTWQSVIIPIADFAPSGDLIDKLEIRFSGKWVYPTTAIDFDSMFFQGGVPQPTGHLRLHNMLSLLDHAPAIAADYGKYLHANAVTGAWEMVTLGTTFHDRLHDMLSPLDHEGVEAGDYDKILHTNETTGAWELIETPTGSGVTEVLVEDTEYDALEQLEYTLGTTYPVTLLRKPSEIVEGGVFTTINDALLEYSITAAKYYILGELYELEFGYGIALDAADPYLPRIDLVILDTSPAVGKITGTPATNPVRPAVDPLTQIVVAEILVQAGLGGILLELTGDVTGMGYIGTSIPTLLDEVNSDVGTFGGTNFTVEMEVDAKGRVISIEEIPIDFPAAALEMDSALGSDHSYSGILTTFVANENQAFGDVVMINSTGKAQLAKADVIANATAMAILVDASVAGNGTGNYMLMGFIRYDDWNWTKGLWIFLSLTGTTGNTLTQTSPSATDQVVQMLGVAYTADSFYFNPQLAQVENK